MVPFRSRSSPGWQRAWDNLTAPLPLYRNYSRYRTMAHWLRPRSLLRCSDSIQCSIRLGTIRASKNSRIRTANSGRYFSGYRNSQGLRLSSVGAGVRANQVADHSLVTGVAPIRFPLEKCKGVVIEGERNFRLLAN